jgi:hypothetical protein
MKKIFDFDVRYRLGDIVQLLMLFGMPLPFAFPIKHKSRLSMGYGSTRPLRSNMRQRCTPSGSHTVKPPGALAST